MRKNQTSPTAAGIAVMRAVESEKPADERICYDPYARRFVPAWMYHVLGFFIRSGYAEWRGPGVNGCLAARDRYIDDVLQGFLKEGLQQLVILGAGYDSRAYRFDLGTVKTFELDHPVAQLDKLAKIRAVFGRVLDHVCYVLIDFNTQTLAEQLLASGYNPGLGTLFIWHGVSMYLTAQVVDDTLAFVVQQSGADSAIVFDHIYQDVLDAARQNEVNNMRRFRFMTGEGLTFGIPSGTISSFLTQRGFREVSDVNAGDLKVMYCTGKNSGRSIVSGYGIAVGKR